MACGSFYPELDFRGNRLQIILNGNYYFECICLNITIINEKSAAILGWTGEPNGPARQFINSFKKIPKDNMANTILYLACEYLGNIYFCPSWWESQTNQYKEHLMDRFQSGIGFLVGERKHNCLSRFEHIFTMSEVEKEFDF